MGKSKKQAAVVAEPIDIAAKKKVTGKRSAGKENGEKASKKLKVGKSKELAKEVEMVAEELAGPPPKARNKAAASLRNGSGKKSKKAGLVSKTQAPHIVPAKTSKKALKEETDDTSDSDVEPAKLPPKFLKKAATKNGAKVTKQGSPSEDSDDDSSEEVNVHKVAAKAEAKSPPKRLESSSEEDSDDSDEEEKPVQKQTALSGKPNVKAPAKKLESSDDEEDSDDSDEEDERQPMNLPTASGQFKGKPPAKKVESSSDEDESDESEELDAKEEKLISKTTASDESDASEDEDMDDDEDEDGVDEDDKVEVKTKSSKKGQDQPKTPAPRAEGGGSKTVFVKNLAWSVDEDILQDFFGSVGEVLEVRLARNEDGRSRGFGHVDFMSTEAANKACEKSGEVLEGRDVFVELARERLFSPGSEGKRDFKSPRGGGVSGGRGQRSEITAFVKGFNKFQDEDSIRNSLTEFFGDCGVQNIRLPTDRETGDIKGFAYVDFSDRDGLAKAIDCSGSDLDGRSLFIEEAGGGGPSSGGGGRGRGRGDFGGGGRGGGFGGRGGRGRGNFGDRGRGGGRGGGRRGGGRGFGSRGGGLSGSGKKTTFGDD